MLKLKYFGMIAEAINKSEEDIKFVGNLDLLTLELEGEYPKLKDLNYKFAVNQTLVATNIALKENDEIALLPPFAGG
ncbi:MAG: MoaD/ThiS family protein [Flavobacteriales bacterium]|jgi:molybdopterin synthase sulfur carrier subunit|tara:strand:- start:3817 stop:4047 length:231 start_codon:yes stop_codon:yes gene_type:complete